MSQTQTLTQQRSSAHAAPWPQAVPTSLLFPSNGISVPFNSRETIALGLLQAVRPRPRQPIADLGWSAGEAWETRRRLRSFEEDWDAPGMDAYDEL